MAVRCSIAGRYGCTINGNFATYTVYSRKHNLKANKMSRTLLQFAYANAIINLQWYCMYYFHYAINTVYCAVREDVCVSV